MSIFRVFIKKPVVLLNHSGRYDETVLLNEWSKGVAKPLLFTLVMSDLFDRDRVFPEQVWFQQCRKHPVTHIRFRHDVIDVPLLGDPSQVLQNLIGVSEGAAT